MKIKGERFYDMETYQKVVFGLPDVSTVWLQPCDIMTVDVDTKDIVGQSTLFVVIVELNTGIVCGTKPTHDQDHAATVAHTLAQRCRDWLNSQ